MFQPGAFGKGSSHASRTLCVLASTEKTGTVILAKGREVCTFCPCLIIRYPQVLPSTAIHSGALKPLVSLLKGHPQLARVLRVAKVLQVSPGFGMGRSPGLL